MRDENILSASPPFPLETFSTSPVSASRTMVMNFLDGRPVLKTFISSTVMPLTLPRGTCRYLSARKLFSTSLTVSHDMLKCSAMPFMDISARSFRISCSRAFVIRAFGDDRNGNDS